MSPAAWKGRRPNWTLHWPVQSCKDKNPNEQSQKDDPALPRKCVVYKYPRPRTTIEDTIPITNIDSTFHGRFQINAKSSRGSLIVNQSWKAIQYI